MTDELHPYPLSGGSYRIIDGKLVREDTPVEPQANPQTESTGDAAATHAETSFFRRRGKNED